ncbi:GPP34 family phosphoprotein [Streptomyces sp. NPDC017179]|uniref:GPP34 family phosphoprotein n=1 Tax=Streptomyces sp. NPDC017179 TaxID=3364979 RepID=UPI00379161BD
MERVAAVDALREGARRVLESPLPAAEVPERDAAVVALAAAAELRTLVPAKDRRRHKARIDELTDRSGAAAPALRRVVREVNAAVIVAATAAATAAG